MTSSLMVEYLMKKIYKVVEGDSLWHLNYDSLSVLFPSNTDQRVGTLLHKCTAKSQRSRTIVLFWEGQL